MIIAVSLLKYGWQYVAHSSSKRMQYLQTNSIYHKDIQMEYY